MKKNYTISILTLTLCILLSGFALRSVAQISITNVSTNSAAPGMVITITGVGFDASAANNTVYFGAIRANTVTGGGATLNVEVPYGAQYSSISVLNNTTMQTASYRNLFLPSYDNNCFIAGTSRFKTKKDVAISSPFASNAFPRHATTGDIDGDGWPDLVVTTYEPSPSAAGHSSVNIYLNNSTVRGIISFDTAAIICTTSNGGLNVKLADLDNDGKLDIVVAASGSGKVSCLRNTSTGTGFANVSFGVKRDLAPGEGPSEVAIADFNNDGLLDIAVVTRDTIDASRLRVFRNTMTLPLASGGFPAAAFGGGLGVYDSFNIARNNRFGTPASIAFGDFNSDGRFDIVTSNTLDSTLTVLQNTSVTGGAITFAPQTNYVAGINPTEVIVADINNDDQPEIVVGVYGTGASQGGISVFRNTSITTTVSFDPTPTFFPTGSPTNSGVYSIAAGDVDGDGHTDIVASRQVANVFSLLKNTHSGTGGAVLSTSFSAIANYPSPSGDLQGISMGDIDKDGKADVILASPGTNKISIFENISTPDTSTSSITASSHQVCVNDQRVVNSNHCAGSTGYWSLSDTTHATIAVGGTDMTATVTGKSAGIDTVIYKVVYLSDTNYVRYVIQIDALADTGNITGPTAVCTDASIVLHNFGATGGVFTSSDASKATVDSTSGVVVGVAAGNAVISYTNTSAFCGTASATHAMTVNPTPNSGTLSTTAPPGTCVGSSKVVTHTGLAGLWENANPTIGTITSSTTTSATVLGIAGGADTILYVVTAGACSDTAMIELGFINSGAPAPEPITGADSICQGTTATLSNSLPGGVWASTNPGVVSVNASTGVITGVSADTTTVSYMVTYGSCNTTSYKLIKVKALPDTGTISGSHNVYVGANITLTTTGSGGIWASSGPTSVATISASGSTLLVHGVAVGSVVISYTASNSCGTLRDTQAVNVLPLPTAPTITTVTPNVAVPLTSITITGTGFDAANTNNVVYFGSKPSTVTSSSSTSLTVTVPDGALYTNIAYLNLSTLLSTTHNGYFLPTYSGSCYVPSSLSFKPRQDFTITSPIPAPSSMPTPYPESLHAAIGDLDGDGKSDIVVSTYYGDSGRSAINIFTNTSSAGNVSYSTTAFIDTSSQGGVSVKLADLDGDGKLDIIVACSGSGVISCLRNMSTPGNLEFGLKADVYPLEGCSQVAIADFDGDGKQDIAAIGRLTSQVKIFHNEMTSIPAGRFPSNFFGPIHTFDSFAVSNGPSDAQGIWAADFDHDGKMDIVTSNFADGSISVLRNNSNSGTFIFEPQVYIPADAGGTLTEVTTADINGDNFPEIIVGDYTSGVVNVFENNSTILTPIAFTRHTYPVTSVGSVSLGDMNGDGKVDIIAGRYNENTFSILQNNFSSSIDAATFAAPVTYATGTMLTQGIAVGDLEGDKKPDVVVVDYNNKVSIFESVGMPAANAIAGVDSVCYQASITLSSPHCAGSAGYWSTTTGNATATVVAGSDTSATIYGNTVGADTVVYAVVYMSDTNFVRFPIMVKALADTGLITGGSAVCVSDTIQLNNTVAGTWSSSNTAVATVTATGVVSGVAPGTAIIRFTTTSMSCGPLTASHAVTVGPLPDAGTITSSASGTCVGQTISLTSIGGGTWANTTPSVATITVISPTQANIGGAAPGTDTVYYIVSSSCGIDTATKVITVIPTSTTTSPITGTPSVCQGDSTQLSTTATGGAWSSANTAIATVDPATGVVYGVAAGNTTISYTASYPCTSINSAIAFTVNNAPQAGAIVASTDSICVNETFTFTNPTGTGTWHSRFNFVSVNATTGVVTGVTPGTDTVVFITPTTSCGTDSIVHAVTVKALPDAGTITGGSTACVGQTITLANAATGGTWSSSAPTVATVNTAGVVTGLQAGSATISYIVNSFSCNSDTATHAVTFNALPNAGAINGTDSVCVNETATLTNTTAGAGTWHSRFGRVPVVATTGVITGIIPGTDTVVFLATSTGCGTDSVLHVVTVKALPDAGTITGGSTACVGQSITLTESVTGGTWSSSAPTVATVNTSGVVTGLAAGNATISYIVNSFSCNSDTATHAVIFNALPNAGAINGTDSVCVNETATLTNTTAGTGTWHSRFGRVTVGATTGVITGITPGTDTVVFLATSTSCGTDSVIHVVTVKALPDAGTITGLSTACVGQNITLTESVTGGTWSSSAPTVATVNTAGVVTGLTAGNATISYIVNSFSCNSDTATHAVSFNALPSAGTIVGADSICANSTVTLTNPSAGAGTWHSRFNFVTVNATTGAVTGITPGTDTVVFVTTATSCGSDSALHAITVKALPDAGIISGASTTCAGQTITLTESVTGGTWSSSAPTVATVDASGVVTGLTAGNATISYIVGSFSCNADTATHAVTINPLPDAGTITSFGGATALCAGTTLSLSNATTGGTWSLTNTTIATITGTGRITGLVPGVDSALYSVTNGCGTAVDTFVFTVDPAPSAGIVSGFDTTCLGSSVTLTSTVTGGVWSSTNTALATVNVTSGVVTTIAAGADTIRYIYTNSCGSDTVNHRLVIIAPVIHAPIAGLDSVCVGSTITLTNVVTGGVWYSTDTSIAKIDSVTGVLTGIATGSSVIHYSVPNYCTPYDTFMTVRVNPLPFADVITGGVDSVCIGTVTTLSDITTGGVWSSSAPAVVTISATGVATALNAGTAIISYTYTNSCGAYSALDTMVVKPTPILSSATASTICSGIPFVYTPAATPAGATFAWSRAAVPQITNPATSGVGGINETLDNIGTTAANAVYVYVITANGCTNTQNLTVTVNPIPRLSSDTTLTICSGSPILYYATTATPGTVFAWTRPAVTGITPTTGSGTFVVNETLTSNSLNTVIAVDYVFTLTTATCSNTQIVHANVEPAPPVAPRITTMSPSYLCSGTMYQNFGTATAPVTGVTYTWSSMNGQVWATGSDDQYCLVNFTNSGLTWVYLTSSLSGFSCNSRDSFAVVVTPNASEHPIVYYMNSDFVCSPSDEDSYQWGYDDASTLDSTLLTGETNQNYYNPAPDPNKLYWVITTRHGCYQKTYYKTPTGIKNVTNGGLTDVKIYPNPNTGKFTVSIASDFTEEGTITVSNILGEKIMEEQCMTNRKINMQINKPAGIYFVTVNTAHGKVTGKVTIAGE